MVVLLEMQILQTVYFYRWSSVYAKKYWMIIEDQASYDGEKAWSINYSILSGQCYLVDEQQASSVLPVMSPNQVGKIFTDFFLSKKPTLNQVADCLHWISWWRTQQTSCTRCEYWSYPRLWGWGGGAVIDGGNDHKNIMSTTSTSFIKVPYTV